MTSGIAMFKSDSKNVGGKIDAGIQSHFFTDIRADGLNGASGSVGKFRNFFACKLQAQHGTHSYFGGG